jgi:biopolymer transport protein ExbD
MFGIKKRKGEVPIDVELPITPMLDMSFQLMAFFIFTFRPMAQEGQLSMYLPKEDVAQTDVVPELPDESQQDEYKVVATSAQGQLATLSLQTPTGTTTIEGDKDTKIEGLEQNLKRIARTGKKGPTVRIVADNNLQYAQLIRLMDACRLAGFDSVGVSPLTPGEVPKQ